VIILIFNYFSIVSTIARIATLDDVLHPFVAETNGGYRADDSDVIVANFRRRRFGAADVRRQRIDSAATEMHERDRTPDGVYQLQDGGRRLPGECPVRRRSDRQRALDSGPTSRPRQAQHDQLAAADAGRSRHGLPGRLSAHPTDKSHLRDDRLDDDDDDAGFREGNCDLDSLEYAALL